MMYATNISLHKAINYKTIIFINLIVIGYILSYPHFTYSKDISGNVLNVYIEKKHGDLSIVNSVLSGVGSEFFPDPKLIENLKNINIKSLRLINVDYNSTKLIDGKLIAPRLDHELQWCNLVGAQPHIIIGQGIPPWLSTKGNDPKFGPNDWDAYRRYIKLFMEHVIVKMGFSNATWEVANEPDTSGAPVPRPPRNPIMSSEEDYQAYFNLYKNISEVARNLEKEHSIKIIIGGPACGPLTFVHGKFNWYERFLKDVSQENLKIDFFSFHYYGNQSSIGNRPNLTGYPPFEEVVTRLRNWISRYKPGLPIWITEWGPSWKINIHGAGIINANNVGAAWSAAFIDTMVRYKIDKAFFLVTADQFENWGWPALFHGTRPKPIYYVFEMFRRLKGQFIEVQCNSPYIGAIAAQDNQQITMVIWNYNWIRGGQLDVGKEGGKMEEINLVLHGVKNGRKYRVKSKLISEDYGNPYESIINIKEDYSVPLVDDMGVIKEVETKIQFNIKLPPSSVILYEFIPVMPTN